MRIIGREEVAQLLDYASAIPLMREAMIALSQGRVRQPLRQIVPLPGDSLFGVMAGAAEPTFGAKLISVFPRNFDLGRQSHQGAVLLFDPADGAPVALIHAGELTAVRTAAASAAAADVLARPDAAVLALLGYGEQALTHARAMSRVRRLSEVRVWGRRPEKAAVIADRLRGELKVPCVASSTARAAVAGAEIVCTVSAASEPILLGEDVEAGTHVSLVGSGHAGAREVDDALVARGRLFADHRESALRQGGEIRHAIGAGLIGDTHVLGEIGDVFAGRLTGRAARSDITLYKSLGSIAQDLAAGWLIYQRAVERGLGMDVVF